MDTIYDYNIFKFHEPNSTCLELCQDMSRCILTEEFKVKNLLNVLKYLPFSEFSRTLRAHGGGA